MLMKTNWPGEREGERLKEVVVVVVFQGSSPAKDSKEEVEKEKEGVCVSFLFRCCWQKHVLHATRIYERWLVLLRDTCCALPPPYR